ncbi:MAG TPA: hypothetical protein DEP53_03885 [Bacteroidetes bacterium]|nr:hypothetical protein [Bacteroidota bacterium]
MKVDFTTIAVLAFLPLLVRTLLYLAALKIRSIRITLLNCIVVAGAPYLVGFVPLPLPMVVKFAAGIFLAMFLLTRYTEAELFPDVVVIPIIVEFASALFLELILIPLLTT